MHREGINWMHLGEGASLSKVYLEGIDFAEAVVIGDAMHPGIAIHQTDGSTEYVRYADPFNRDVELRQLKAVLEKSKEKGNE